MSFPEGLLSHSLKLTPEESEALTDLLFHQNCKVRSSAVVQVFGTSPPYHDEWIKRHIGVALFVADCHRRSFYIQVYDPPTCNRVFEQELYKEFYYAMESYCFHQFEGDNEMIGLDFVDEQEAAAFADQITKHLEKRRLKAKNRTQNLGANQNFSENQNPLENYTATAPTESFDLRTPNHHLKKKRLKNKIRKSEIGNPENFIHVSHVGYNSDVTSAANSQEAILATILEMSNIKPKELEDETKKEDFLNFIETNGGIEKVYKKLKAKKITSGTFSQTSISRAIKKTASICRPKAHLPDESHLHAGYASPSPQNTTSTAQTTLTSGDSSFVPELPSGFGGWNSLVNHGNTLHPLSQHSYQEPPLHQTQQFPIVPQFGVPQTQSSLPALQPLPVSVNTRGAQSQQTQPPVPPPMAKPPLPSMGHPPSHQMGHPPQYPMGHPPPPPMGHPPPPPAPHGSLKPSGLHGNIALKKQHSQYHETNQLEEVSSRDDLMNQIRNAGVCLKKQDHQTNQQEETTGRDDLLNQIRNKGFKLKKVEDVEEERVPSARFENSLIASLAQTLDHRNRVCRGTSDEDDSDSDVGSGSDSDEWD